MRIGVLTTSWPRPDDAAAGGFVAGFARWLAAHVGDVEVLRADPRRPLFADGGAPLHLRDPRRWSDAARFTGRLLGAAARHVRRWDALVSHWLVPSGIAASAVAGTRPHLAIAHGSDARLLQALPGGATVARAIARRAELVYVAEALALDGAAGRVVPMGVDVASLRGGDRATTRAALGVEGDALVALFLGRLVDDKGADALVEAALRLPSCMAVIAGDGPARPALEHRLAPVAATARARVRLVGRVDAAYRRALLAAADVLVLPSRREGAPQAIAEAQAVGLPVVATAVGGVPVLVGDAGLLLAPPMSTGSLAADPALVAALVAALDSLARDADLRRRLAVAAAARGDDRDWSVVGPQLWPATWSRARGVHERHGTITIVTI